MRIIQSQSLIQSASGTGNIVVGGSIIQSQCVTGNGNTIVGAGRSVTTTAGMSPPRPWWWWFWPPNWFRAIGSLVWGQRPAPVQVHYTKAMLERLASAHAEVPKDTHVCATIARNLQHNYVVNHSAGHASAPYPFRITVICGGDPRSCSLVAEPPMCAAIKYDADGGVTYTLHPDQTPETLLQGCACRWTFPPIRRPNAAESDARCVRVEQRALHFGDVEQVQTTFVHER